MSGRMRFVIDASVACKWFIDESGSDAARDMLARALLAEHGSWVGPELFHCEVLNAVRKSRPRGARLADVARFLAAIPMRSIGFDEEIGSAVAGLARQGIGVYDAFYAAVAERHSAVLWTADARLARALGAPAWVKLLS